MQSNRAGTFTTQPSGYKSFVPAPLPPNPKIHFDDDMLGLLSEADRKLGRLDGVTQVLPNPELFVAMYVRKEAVLSSQIEGTQASLSDILIPISEKRSDINEVVNYVKAMNYGLQRLHDFPLSLRLIREIHAHLLNSGRGSSRNPGEFRKTQNWIGPAGCTINDATFVPPAVPDMNDALSALEKFFYDDSSIPSLIKIALIHAQFESIHPFLDGNGRMGRLLITFWLCQKGILSQPLLYLSYYFKQNRQEYYAHLMNVRLRGDWENWIKFFLQGIAYVSDESINTAKKIISLQSACEKSLRSYNNVNHSRLLDYLFEYPYINRRDVKTYLNITYPTAAKLINDFCQCGILHDITPNQQRNKLYEFDEYMKLLNRGTELQ